MKREATDNTAGAALIALREALSLPFGFEVEIDKGIPLGSGMGGSAASCVAALVAANALLDTPLSRQALYPFALTGEAVASGGRHGDNLGPMLLAYVPCHRRGRCGFGAGCLAQRRVLRMHPGNRRSREASRATCVG